jgi:anion-transporting  ArsA/GET3 family ATPase
MDYSCIVFDTAPTGHTLRLLQFPSTLEKGLSKLMSLKETFGGMIGQVSRMMGPAGAEDLPNQLMGKLEQLKVRSQHLRLRPPPPLGQEGLGGKAAPLGGAGRPSLLPSRRSRRCL